MEERVGNSSHKVRTGVVASVMAVFVVGLVTLGSADRVSDSHGPTAASCRTRSPRRFGSRRRAAPRTSRPTRRSR